MIFTFWAASPTRVYMSQMTEALNLTRAQIVYSMEAGEELGIIRRGSFRVGSKRRSTLYCVIDPAGSSEDVEAVREKGPDGGLILSDSVSDLVGDDYEASAMAPKKAELVTGLYFVGALRTRHEKTGGRYRRRLAFGRDYMDVEVATEFGTDPMAILDLRVYFAILSICRSRAALGTLAENGKIEIHIPEVISVMKWSNDGGRRSQVIGAIKRFETTAFTIEQVTTRLKERIGDFAIKEKIRLIVPPLSWIEDRSNGLVDPIAVRLALYPAVYEYVADPNSNRMLTVHPEIMSEDSPTVLALYLWCRKTVHHRKDWMSRSVDLIQKALWPHKSPGEVNKLINRVFRERQVRNAMILCGGYEMCRTGDREWSFRALKDDVLLGENSYYSHRQRLKELEDGDREGMGETASLFED
ncbi:MAG: hypothetical protein ACPGU7_13245 [Gammaproteobacteria bacterium]